MHKNSYQPSFSTGSKEANSITAYDKIVPDMWSANQSVLEHASVCLDLDTMDLVVSLCELGVMHSMTPSNDPLNPRLGIRTKVTLVHGASGASVVKLKTHDHKGVMQSR